MTGGKKVIGVCVTKVQDSTRALTIDKIFEHTKAMGYKLMVFNSFADFFYNDENDEGAAAVYDLIDYEVVDALIILCSGFHKKAVYEKIITKALAYGVPVILEEQEYAGCYTIKGRFEDCYESLMEHVICNHGAKDTFFIAGIKGNADSEAREKCWRNVLERNGLPFDESMVDYGFYWDGPTNSIIDRLCSDGKKPPQAIFCANDTMAMAACKRLRHHGFRIPEDVIVTGFDGTRVADFSRPKLSTCSSDNDGFVRAYLDTVEKLFEGMECERVRYVDFRSRYSESCGCDDGENIDYRLAADDYHGKNEDMLGHEDYMFLWLDKMMAIDDINSLYSSFVGYILANSYLVLNRSFIAAAASENAAEKYSDNELIVVASARNENEGIQKNIIYPRKDMVPFINEWKDEHSLYLISSVHVGSIHCGYYEIKTDSLTRNAHKVNRVQKTLNIAFNAAVKGLRHRFMKYDNSRLSMTDPITGLPNLRGASNWFEEFASDKNNHEKAVTVSIYCLPKYKYIYENYGLQDVEEAVCFVAESLKISNQADCFIAHISDDEFVVINYVDREEDITPTINNATTVFFGVLGGYNNSNGKDYYVDVNCGCTVANPGWSDKLESFIKLATAEMYINRLTYGTVPAAKQEKSSKDNYNAFNVLVEKNLFLYYFQPIISASTGEIYAYEALMRTDKSIGLNPLEILQTASDYNRLYDIEKATMFNVMERYSRDNEKFCGRKVFINSIPGYFLNDDDNRILSEKYSSLISNFVFEITEQNTVEDDELSAIKRVGNAAGDNPIAVDDYGTGHSNIVNLMRYSPQIIKIDRFLISDIQNDQNKQMFVKSTIEFARMNGIKVLAEGVETAEEMKTVIEFGVDYIQGYYTGKPAPEPISEIDEKVRNELLEANNFRGW